MKINWKYLIIFLIIILGATIVRFYQLNKLPPGLIIDESSEGYNAFSLLHTGKDRYGQSFPVLFRSFGSFQAPLYTYLSIIPIYFFKNTIFSIRVVSAVSGVILVVITFLLFNDLRQKKETSLKAIAALLVAFSPWSIYFSRFATEASLGVTLFSIGFLLLYFSIKRLWFFLPALFILGLSTHAYYSERLISPFFITVFIYLCRKNLLKNKKILILGLFIFIITQIPHLMILNTGAFTRRISQVDYFNDQFFQRNGGQLNNIPFGKSLFVAKEFSSQYLAYFSPKNLFFDPDPQGARSMPDLSVFYSWMIIPFIFGLRLLILNRSLLLNRMIILLIILSPIPASLTKDPFATIRTLVFLWSMTIVIAFGTHHLLQSLFRSRIKILIFLGVISFSLIQLYISYFVLLKYERSRDYGYSYLELLKEIRYREDQRFVVDSSRDLGVGVSFAYLIEYDPSSLQQILSRKIKSQYYSNFEFGEPYILDNIEVRPIAWEEDIYKERILVGDLLAISAGQAKEHYLHFLFDIKDMSGDVALKAYKTDPKANCNASKAKGEAILKYCQRYL